jgi:glycosyltransferase involved in cell wall biosynthesis
MLNVLIRTGNSPDGFKRAVNSVKAQTYRPFRIIVSYDSPVSEAYTTGFDRIKVVRKAIKSYKHKPYNLYLNQLFQAVKEGWIFVLDDDDWIENKEAFRFLLNGTSEDTLVLMRMRWPDGRIIPEDGYFGKKPVVKHIGMPCILFHSNWKNCHTFDEGRRADFKLVTKLCETIPYVFYYNHVVVQTGNTGRHGNI